jgi:AcrR family transcriptional regulator
MPRPPTVTHQPIVKQARSYFLIHGHTASIKALAQEMGISHAAIFQRFGSKKALLIKALRPPKEIPWTQEIHTRPQNATCAFKELLEIARLLFEFFKHHMPCIQLLRVAGVQPQEVFKEGHPMPLVACEYLSLWIKRSVQKSIFISCDENSVALTIVGSIFARTQMQKINQPAMNGGWSISLGTLEGSLAILIRGLLVQPDLLELKV